MPPRHTYWTIIVGNQPTAFRSATQDELLPTLRQLQSKHADAVMMWYARAQAGGARQAGVLSRSRTQARVARPAERRSPSRTQTGVARPAARRSPSRTQARVARPTARRSPSRT